MDVLISITDLIRFKRVIFKKILLNEIFSVFLTLMDRSGGGLYVSQVSRN